MGGGTNGDGLTGTARPGSARHRCVTRGMFLDFPSWDKVSLCTHTGLKLTMHPGDAAQLLECLPSMREVLGSILSTTMQTETGGSGVQTPFWLHGESLTKQDLNTRHLTVQPSPSLKLLTTLLSQPPKPWGGRHELASPTIFSAIVLAKPSCQIRIQVPGTLCGTMNEGVPPHGPPPEPVTGAAQLNLGLYPSPAWPRPGK